MKPHEDGNYSEYEQHGQDVIYVGGVPNRSAYIRRNIVGPDAAKQTLDTAGSHILGYDEESKTDYYCCYFIKEEYDTIISLLMAHSNCGGKDE